MGRSIFNSLKNQNPSSMYFNNNTNANNVANNLQQTLSNFNQFKNSFQGNPKDKVQELLNTGKMTQQQFNNLSAVARQLQNLIGK